MCFIRRAEAAGKTTQRQKGDGSEADSAVRSEITIAALAKEGATRKLDGERTSDAAEGGATTRRTMGGSTDGTIARIGGAAANEAARQQKTVR